MGCSTGSDASGRKGQLIAISILALSIGFEKDAPAADVYCPTDS
jgi:hypothetical protein